jgi:hypothetical protein
MKTARTETVSLILGVLVAATIAACAARSPRTVASKPAAQDAGTSHDWTGRGNPRDEIATFDDQIAHDLAQLGLDAPTQDDVISRTVAHDLPALPMSTKVQETCPDSKPASSACEDVCTLADSICTSAGRICAIADDLATDDYATERCSAGKLSCERGTERCCGCT